MAKSLGSLWLKSVKRLGKAQQSQSRKLFRSLVTQAVKTATASRPAGKSVGKTPRLAVAKPRRPAAKAAPRKAATASAPALQDSLPGSFRKSYFSVPAAGSSPARRMLYSLYLPSGQTMARLPLVVMLHGCQQTATDFATSTRMNALAERKGFAVLYPQQSAGTDRHRCWHWYKRPTQQGGGDVAVIAAMVTEVQARHGLDATRTYVAGLSAGAGLAALLALNRPELFAALGLHSAPVFGTADSPLSGYGAMQQGSASHSAVAGAWVAAHPSLAAVRGMPAMLIHGGNDTVVRRVNLHQLMQQFRIVNAGAITSELPLRQSYPARHGGRNPRHGWQSVTYLAGRRPQLVSCEIDGLGHAWSGGDSSVAFSAPQGPDASLMLWTFFARHALPVI